MSPPTPRGRKTKRRTKASLVISPTARCHCLLATSVLTLQRSVEHSEAHLHTTFTPPSPALSHYPHVHPDPTTHLSAKNNTKNPPQPLGLAPRPAYHSSITRRTTRPATPIHRRTHPTAPQHNTADMSPPNHTQHTHTPRALFALLTPLALLALHTPSAHALFIDNDIPLGTPGHFSVDIRIAGEAGFSGSLETRITAATAQGGVTTDTRFVYDYYSYINTGSGPSRRLSLGVSAQPFAAGQDAATSSGSFTGSNGNLIDWTATSSIPNLGDTMTTAFHFSARTGTLGDLTFYRYLDEDIGSSARDDVFFTRGTAATGDLRLFTIDDDDAFGLSQSGSFTPERGLANATFLGWAMDEFNHMEGPLFLGTQSVDPLGVIDQAANSTLPLFEHPQAGPAYGPEDIVSLLAWQADPNKPTATIITSLGGVPDPQLIPNPDPPPPPPPAPIPEPTTAATLLLLTALTARPRPSRP